jgi:hypothetical protein
MQTRAEFIHSGGGQDFEPRIGRNIGQIHHFRRARAFFGERKL